jgi:hypothetical protein
MRIVFKQKRRLYVLKTYIPLVFYEDTNDGVMTKFQRHLDDD